MTSPTTKSDKSDQSDDEAAPGEDQTVPRRDAASSRPPGQVGGHTVQDWEQGSSMPVPRRATASQERPAASQELAPQGSKQDLVPEASKEISQGAILDDPSPETTPIVLRKGGPSSAPVAKPQRPAFDARTHTLSAQSSALVDAITRELGQAIAEALRPAVASSIDRLVPMLLSFGSVPDPVASTAPVGDAPQDAGST